MKDIPRGLPPSRRGHKSSKIRTAIFRGLPGFLEHEGGIDHKTHLVMVTFALADEDRPRPETEVAYNAVTKEDALRTLAAIGGPGFAKVAENIRRPPVGAFVSVVMHNTATNDVNVGHLAARSPDVSAN